MLVILTVAAVTGLIGWFVGHEMGTASSEAQGNLPPVTSTSTGTTIAPPVSAPIVSMPHWGGILSDDQLNALVAYIKTLKTD